jgi:hypothetical protein
MQNGDRVIISFRFRLDDDISRYYSLAYKVFMEIHNKDGYIFYIKYHLKLTITNMATVSKIYVTSYTFKV